MGDSHSLIPNHNSPFFPEIVRRLPLARLYQKQTINIQDIRPYKWLLVALDFQAATLVFACRIFGSWLHPHTYEDINDKIHTSNRYKMGSFLNLIRKIPMNRIHTGFTASLPILLRNLEDARSGETFGKGRPRQDWMTRKIQTCIYPSFSRYCRIIFVAVCHIHPLSLPLVYFMGNIFAHPYILEPAGAKG